jgi:hypothetical protein
MFTHEKLVVLRVLAASGAQHRKVEIDEVRDEVRDEVVLNNERSQRLRLLAGQRPVPTLEK